jgi:hypothetical protein
MQKSLSANPAGLESWKTSRPGADSGVAALSIEFVAKPQEAVKIRSAIPEAIAGALREVTGFSGCFVMVSNQEARLVTVVTLWTGAERVQRCSENTRWVRAILKPYLDHCLRIQTLAAFIPATQELSPVIGDSASRPVQEIGVEDEALQFV